MLPVTFRGVRFAGISPSCLHTFSLFCFYPAILVANWLRPNFEQILGPNLWGQLFGRADRFSPGLKPNQGKLCRANNLPRE